MPGYLVRWIADVGQLLNVTITRARAFADVVGSCRHLLLPLADKLILEKSNLQRPSVPSFVLAKVLVHGIPASIALQVIAVFC